MPAALHLPGFFQAIRLPSIGSTSDELKRLAAAGAEEGTLVWADEQTDGHGRFGRSWISPPGNLYASLLLRPDRASAEAVQLTFAAAVALAEVAAAVLPASARVGCKWPNDVLVGGRKVSGILLESQTRPDGTIDGLVVGIGVNVASHPPPEAVMYTATSLHAEGAVGETAASVLQRFCPVFLGWYETWRRQGFAPVRAAWLDRAEKLHQQVEVRLDAETVSGTFVGLDASGAMLIQQGERQRTILAGDVFPATA
jgi:BirA family biotin operon repressor/biotin-[acetyl-CoA-carboxylase] ligase